MTTVLHLSVGAGAGLTHALIASHPRLEQLPPLPRGLLFGSGVWLLAYAGVLPAIGLMPPPDRDERRRPAAMLLAHWVFGATVAVLHARGRRQPRARR